MLNLVTESDEVRHELVATLDNIAREGARRMLVAALTLEVGKYIRRHAEHCDDNGRRL